MSRSLVGGLVVAAMFGLAVRSGAGIINVGWNASQAALGNLDGSPAVVGDFVEIGTFTPGFDIAANQSNLSTLEANFTAFTNSTVGTGFGFPGIWTVNSSGSDLSVGGTRIYLWTFNTPSPATATQQGIFSSSIAAWNFPLSSSPITSTTIDLSDVNQLFVGKIGPTVVVGGQSLPSFDMLAIVPEPTALLLTVLGFLPFLLLRRRR